MVLRLKLLQLRYGRLGRVTVGGLAGVLCDDDGIAHGACAVERADNCLPDLKCAGFKLLISITSESVRYVQ